MRALLFLPCLAGAAAIGFELSWAHSLTFIAGNSVRSMAMVVGCLLFGLTLGSALAARLRSGSGRPWRLVAVEGGLGVLGLVYPWAFQGVGFWLSSSAEAVPDLSVLRYLVLAALLIPPGVLWGLSLPLWADFFERRALLVDSPARGFGSLAAAQTLGGAVGAVVVGFVAIPRFGFDAASLLCGGVDLAVAATVLLLPSRRVENAAPAPDRSAREAALVSPAIRLLRGLLFLAGVASMGFQAVWTRALIFFCDGLHDALTAVLTIFLLGLALGGGVVAGLAPRLHRPGRFLAWSQTALSLTALLSLHLLPRIGSLASEWLSESLHPRWVLLSLAGILFLLPATFLGMTLPLAAVICHRGEGTQGPSLARAATWISFGNVCGALFVPMLLVPALGTPLSWVALAFLGVLVSAGFAQHRRNLFRIALLGLGAAVAVSSALVARSEPSIRSSHVFRGRYSWERELLSHVEGESCSVSVVRDRRRGIDTLYTDAFAAASTGREYPYMRLLGHLPAALAANLDRALVICFGTGTTAGALSLHPGLSHLRIVDVEAEVFKVAPLFRSVNHGVLEGRAGLRVEAIVEDGRFDLLASRRGWDVITLEPLMPYTPAAVGFYTKEFYELAKSRLREGGVLCQWLPIHAIPVQGWRSLVATFAAVMPACELFLFEQSVLLVGRRGETTPSFVEFQRRLEVEAVAKNLQASLVLDASDLLAARIAGGSAIKRVLKDDRLLRDDDPFVIFLDARPESEPFLALSETLQVLVELEAEERREPSSERLSPTPEGEDLARLQRCQKARQRILSGRAAEALARRKAAIDPGGPGWRADTAVPMLEEALKAVPGHLEAKALRTRVSALVATANARRALIEGDPMAALTHLGDPSLTDPDTSRDALVVLALHAASDTEAALLESDRVLARHPKQVEVLAVRSRILMRLARAKDAREADSLGRGWDEETFQKWLELEDRAVARARALQRVDVSELRKRLRRLVARDILGSPEDLAAARRDFARDLEARSPVVLLLRQELLSLEDSEADPERGIQSIRALALLDAPGTAERLSSLSLDGKSDEFVVSMARARAALLRNVSTEVRAALTSKDVVVRRLAAYFAADRLEPGMAEELRPFALDADADVRLYVERALRRLRGPGGF